MFSNSPRFWDVAFLLTTNSPGVNIAGTVSVPRDLISTCCPCAAYIIPPDAFATGATAGGCIMPAISLADWADKVNWTLAIALAIAWAPLCCAIWAAYPCTWPKYELAVACFALTSLNILIDSCTCGSACGFLIDCNIVANWGVINPSWFSCAPNTSALILFASLEEPKNGAISLTRDNTFPLSWANTPWAALWAS